MRGFTKITDRRSAWISRFFPKDCSFLHDTPNQTLQIIRTHLVKQLALAGEISFKYLSTDSCPIQANVKENNLKTIARDRFDKTKIPKRDLDCRPGTIVTFPFPS